MQVLLPELAELLERAKLPLRLAPARMSTSLRARNGLRFAPATPQRAGRSCRSGAVSRSRLTGGSSRTSALSWKDGYGYSCASFAALDKRSAGRQLGDIGAHAEQDDAESDESERRGLESLRKA